MERRNSDPTLPQDPENQDPILPQDVDNQDPTLPEDVEIQDPTLPEDLDNQDPPLPPNPDNQDPILPLDPENQDQILPQDLDNQDPPLPPDPENQDPRLPQDLDNQDPPLPPDPENQDEILPQDPANGGMNIPPYKRAMLKDAFYHAALPAPHDNLFARMDAPHDNLFARMDAPHDNLFARMEVPPNPPPPPTSDQIVEILINNNVDCNRVQYNDNRTPTDIMNTIRSIIAEDPEVPFDDSGVKLRCCLFEDQHRRLFNLVISEHSVGPAAEWTTLLHTFSGIQAIIAVTVLCRNLPCAFVDDIGQMQPAILALILGLVLEEELSLSWLNSSMMVRRLPSVSAHSLTTSIESDWLRKIATLILALASATTGSLQKVMTLLGILLSEAILLANLGSHAWRSMKWKRLEDVEPFPSIFAYFIAIITGILFPFMGCRELEAGASAAVDNFMFTAVVVAVVFVLSDIDAIQNFVVLGSETCPQNEVNVIVGVWLTLTVLSSLTIILKRQAPTDTVAHEEHLLIPAQDSPVGFKVPDIPDYIFDPNLARKEWLFCSKEAAWIFGVILAFAIGAGILCLNYLVVWEEVPNRF